MITNFANYIKDKSTHLTVLGFILFVLAVVAGIFWFYGYEIEPVTFILCGLSALCSMLPNLAQIISPNRQPIKNMSHEELLDFILTTSHENDWETVNIEWTQDKFLKEDPRLRVRVLYTDEGCVNNDFKEDWANKHPDPKASSYGHDILYDGNILKRVTLVSVDSGRATLPLPDRQTLELKSELDYKIASLFNQGSELDEYIQRSGLTKNF